MKTKAIILPLVALFTASTLSVSAKRVKEYPSFGDKEITVFSNENLVFNPDKFNTTTADANGVIHLVGGRLVLKKITVPEYARTTDTFITLALKSNGDRWDKSGSCFVIPNESITNFISVESGKDRLPLNIIGSDTLKGVASMAGYKPVVELMRFMTPFGVGFYSDDRLGRKPVYIDSWAQNVVWTDNITRLLPRLEGEVWVGVWIDVWTPEGYLVDLTLSFDESNLAFDGKMKKVVEPLVNTVYYAGGQSHPDFFSRSPLDVEFNIPEGAKNVRLYYTTTGHGGHSYGDEFVKKQNIVLVDGKAVIDFVPWRNDCASFRRYNPGTGVWLRKRVASYIDEKGGYSQKEVEEPLGSSDLSRSNWCPGSIVLPEEVKLGNIASGVHTLRIDIPGAQAAEGDKLNHWLVSAYIVYDI